MELEGKREGGKKKYIEGEMWREKEGVIRGTEIYGERSVGGKRDRQRRESEGEERERERERRREREIYMDKEFICFGDDIERQGRGRGR